MTEQKPAQEILIKVYDSENGDRTSGIIHRKDASPVVEILEDPVNSRGYLLSQLSLRLARAEITSPNGHYQDSVNTLQLLEELPEDQKKDIENGTLHVGIIPGELPKNGRMEIIVQFHSNK